MAKNRYAPKFFRVATEGDTIDGREITRRDIEDMVETYNPKERHGARVWTEHFRGLIPGNHFDALGDVHEVKKEELKEGPHKGKLALFALIKPLQRLIDYNSAQQKVFTSIEMVKNYCNTGKTYLFGIAATDSPSAQGTERLAFSVGGYDIVSGPSYEHEFSFDEEENSETRASLFSTVMEKIGLKNQRDNETFSDIRESVIAIADSQHESLNQLDEMGRKLNDASAEFTALKTAHEELLASFNEMKQKLEETAPGTFAARPASNGSTGDAVQTDC